MTTQHLTPPRDALPADAAMDLHNLKAALQSAKNAAHALGHYFESIGSDGERNAFDTIGRDAGHLLDDVNQNEAELRS